MDWRDRAACLEEDPELFFPIGNTGPALLQIEEAKMVCRRCDVQDTCLKWALESGQDAGVEVGLAAGAGTPVLGVRGPLEAPGLMLHGAVSLWCYAIQEAVDVLTLLGRCCGGWSRCG